MKNLRLFMCVLWLLCCASWSALLFAPVVEHEAAHIERPAEAIENIKPEDFTLLQKGDVKGALDDYRESSDDLNRDATLETRLSEAGLSSDQIVQAKAIGGLPDLAFKSFERADNVAAFKDDTTIIRYVDADKRAGDVLGDREKSVRDALKNDPSLRSDSLLGTLDEKNSAALKDFLNTAPTTEQVVAEIKKLATVEVLPEAGPAAKTQADYVQGMQDVFGRFSPDKLQTDEQIGNLYTAIAKALPLPQDSTLRVQVIKAIVDPKNPSNLSQTYPDRRVREKVMDGLGQDLAKTVLPDKIDDRLAVIKSMNEVAASFSSSSIGGKAVRSAVFNGLRDAVQIITIKSAGGDPSMVFTQLEQVAKAAKDAAQAYGNVGLDKVTLDAVSQRMQNVLGTVPVGKSFESATKQLSDYIDRFKPLLGEQRMNAVRDAMLDNLTAAFRQEVVKKGLSGADLADFVKELKADDLTVFDVSKISPADDRLVWNRVDEVVKAFQDPFFKRFENAIKAALPPAGVRASGGSFEGEGVVRSTLKDTIEQQLKGTADAARVRDVLTANNFQSSEYPDWFNNAVRDAAREEIGSVIQAMTIEPTLTDNRVELMKNLQEARGQFGDVVAGLIDKKLEPIRAADAQAQQTMIGKLSDALKQLDNKVTTDQASVDKLKLDGLLDDARRLLDEGLLTDDAYGKLQQNIGETSAAFSKKQGWLADTAAQSADPVKAFEAALKESGADAQALRTRVQEIIDTPMPYDEQQRFTMLETMAKSDAMKNLTLEAQQRVRNQLIGAMDRAVQDATVAAVQKGDKTGYATEIAFRQRIVDVGVKTGDAAVANAERILRLRALLEKEGPAALGLSDDDVNALKVLTDTQSALVGDVFKATVQVSLDVEEKLDALPEDIFAATIQPQLAELRDAIAVTEPKNKPELIKRLSDVLNDVYKQQYTYITASFRANLPAKPGEQQIQKRSLWDMMRNQTDVATALSQGLDSFVSLAKEQYKETLNKGLGSLPEVKDLSEKDAMTAAQRYAQFAELKNAQNILARGVTPEARELFARVDRVVKDTEITDKKAKDQLMKDMATLPPEQVDIASRVLADSGALFEADTEDMKDAEAFANVAEAVVSGDPGRAYDELNFWVSGEDADIKGIIARRSVSQEQRLRRDGFKLTQDTLQKQREALERISTLVKGKDVIGIGFQLDALDARIKQLKAFGELKTAPETLKRADGTEIARAKEMGLQLMILDDQRAQLRSMYNAAEAEGKPLQDVADILDALRQKNDGRSIDPTLDYAVHSKIVDKATQDWIDVYTGKTGKLGTVIAWFNKTLPDFTTGFVRVWLKLSKPELKISFKDVFAKSAIDFVEWTRKEDGVTSTSGGDPVIGLILYDTGANLPEMRDGPSPVFDAAYTVTMLRQKMPSDAQWKPALADPFDPNLTRRTPEDLDRLKALETDEKLQVLVQEVVKAEQGLQRFTSLKPAEFNAQAQAVIEAYKWSNQTQQKLMINIVSSVETKQRAIVLAKDPNFAKWTTRDVTGASTRAEVLQDVKKFADNLTDFTQRASFLQSVVDYTSGILADLRDMRNFISTASQSELPLAKNVRDASIAGLDLYIKGARASASTAFGITQK